MTHANGTTGPQVGHAALMQDGTLYKSSALRPVLALSDIQTQIARANADRYTVGKPAHDAPQHLGQLLPLFAYANPRIEALVAGLTPAPAYVVGSGHAHQNHNRRQDKRAMAESRCGWSEHAA
jgi:hypothetical protein